MSYDKYVFKTKEKKNEVVLAIFGFDLSELSKPFNFCNEHNNGNQPELLYFDSRKQKQIEQLYLINHVNITMPEKFIEYHKLLQDSLIEHEIILNVKVRFQSDALLMGRTESLLNTKYLQRLFIIFFDRVAFNSIYQLITNNHNYIITEEYFGVNKINLSDSDDNADVITGFVIDNHKEILFYIEGECIGLIPRLLYILTSFSEAAVKVHFNSKLLFDERIYERFINDRIGGILKIDLVYPLQHILNNAHFYTTGNVPLGCFNVSDYAFPFHIFYSSHFSSYIHFTIFYIFLSFFTIF